MWYNVTNQSKIDWVCNVCRNAAGGNPEHRGVPFETPVSVADETRFDPDSIAAFKADGTRYYLVLTVHEGRNIACFVNRKCKVYSIEVDASVDMFAMGMGSVFDGELCSYLSAPSHRLFLVFNTLMDRGIPYFDRAFRSRLAAVTRNFPQSVMTAKESRHSFGFVLSRHPSLHIIAKPYFSVTDMSGQARVGSTMFPSDGFIITSLSSVMTAGRNYNILKFKYTQTIDFMTECDGDDVAEVRLYAADQGVEVPACSVMSCYVPKDPNFQKVICGHRLYHKIVNPGVSPPPFRYIVEYVMRPEHETDSVRLEYLRIRADKDRANDVVTVRGTLDSAVSNITVDSIVENIIDMQKHGTPSC
jgi:hypothetical protein